VKGYGDVDSDLIFSVECSNTNPTAKNCLDIRVEAIWLAKRPLGFTIARQVRKRTT
jgi:hypothetical protein